MRIFFIFPFLFFFHLPSFAKDCGADVLGVARTIELVSQKNQQKSLMHFFGHEKELGLNDKEIILTFDDGPKKGTTEKVLRALKKQCVKATFFVVGKMANFYPQILTKVAADGHTIAHHTHDHEKLPLLSRRKIRDVVNGTAQLVEKIAYGENNNATKTPFFRYPYLYYNKKTDSVLARDGWMAFGANIESRDWEATSANQIFKTIIKNIETEKKGIILMHDINAKTAEMLPRLLRYLKRHKYKIVHIKSPRSKTSQSVSVAEVQSKQVENAQPQFRPTQTEISGAEADGEIETPAQNKIAPIYYAPSGELYYVPSGKSYNLPDGEFSPSE